MTQLRPLRILGVTDEEVAQFVTAPGVLGRFTVQQSNGLYLHSFLSNFHYLDPKGDVERAYQAGKTMDEAVAQEIFGAPTAGAAKRMGRDVSPLRPDWDDYRFILMVHLQVVKYKDQRYQDALVATEGYELVEGNTWHDQYWGDCTCPKHADIPGENHLGRILMELRDHIIIPTRVAASSPSE